jgi:hypothetical protein
MLRVATALRFIYLPITRIVMKHALIAFVCAFTLACVAPAWACVPPPMNASNDTAAARAVFVGRVVSVERADPTECLAAARNRAGLNLPRDPGARACEAFGFATLEPAWVIKGEDVATGPFRVAWNEVGYCTAGWTAEVGGLAIVMVPDDARTLRDGVTATVEGTYQTDPLFSTILKLVAEIQP